MISFRIFLDRLKRRIIGPVIPDIVDPVFGTLKYDRCISCWSNCPSDAATFCIIIEGSAKGPTDVQRDAYSLLLANYEDRVGVAEKSVVAYRRNLGEFDRPLKWVGVYIPEMRTTVDHVTWLIDFRAEGDSACYQVTTDWVKFHCDIA